VDARDLHRVVLSRRRGLVGIGVGVLAALGLVAVARADADLPGFAVREADHVVLFRPLPVRLSSGHAATVTPKHTSKPFNPFFPSLTLQQAQARLPFHLLVPAGGIPGLALTAAKMPPVRSDPPSVILDYHRPGAPPGFPPLLILEDGVGFRTGLAPKAGLMEMVVLRGTSEATTVSGQPAIYLKALTTQREGAASAHVDPGRHAVIVERAGVLVHLIGWRTAGIDRAMLERVAASLQ